MKMISLRFTFLALVCLSSFSSLQARDLKHHHVEEGTITGNEPSLGIEEKQIDTIDETIIPEETLVDVPSVDQEIEGLQARHETHEDEPVISLSEPLVLEEEPQITPVLENVKPVPVSTTKDAEKGTLWYFGPVHSEDNHASSRFILPPQFQFSLPPPAPIVTEIRNAILNNLVEKLTVIENKLETMIDTLKATTAV